MFWDEVGTLLGMLLAVAAVLLLAYFFTRYFAGRGANGGLFSRRGGKNTGNIQLLERVSLGREQSLVVAQVGGQYLLLGVSPAGITLLKELSGEEAEQWQKKPPAPPDPQGMPMRFQDALKEVLKQRKK